MERRYRVLALDDSDLVHANLRMLFRAHPRVDLTCTGKWIDVAESCRMGNPPDLLILELGLADVRGELVGLGVRNHARHVPIVIFSSEAKQRIQLAIETTGARAALAKSDGNALVREVMAILEPAC